MVSYAYRCPADGAFDVRRDMGQAAKEEACPRCGAPSGRVFTAPHVGRIEARLARVMSVAAETASNPAVVSAPPPRDRPARASAPHPATARLPRP